MKDKNYVNLTVNPCKMCMPLGAVTAFYGVQGCMSIIHGSQGCSTYIRRHMATHYNEPVDIASSSLTEQGTVYGGEENLISGLKNLIKLYAPRVIGISTTCLAETIGEDVPRILAKIKDEEFCRGVSFIPVSSPGYGGTQYEGWFAATRAIVDTLAEKGEPNDSINIITPPMSPAEHRELKRIIDMFGIKCMLLPDISENLDRVYNPVYERLPQGGTRVENIRRMGGAAYTLELGLFSGQHSTGALLNERFGIPFERLPMPIGLRGTDLLIKKLSELCGRAVPEELKKERGRYLDAMVDSHKYCGVGRAVIFGEPDLVYGITRLCLESGVFPAVVAVGGKAGNLRELLDQEIAAQAAIQLQQGYEIVTETDFEKIGELAVKHKANMMIGSSDGRRIEEKTAIPLIRVGFPIHDRVGGQRQMNVGYTGSLSLMDQMANEMLRKAETSFRAENYQKYFTPKEEIQNEQISGEMPSGRSETEKKTLGHPCFSCSASGNARIHLPVAPACNIRCNYCTRKFDCVNESRPGVTSEVLTPEQAAARFIEVKKELQNLTVVGIAGPGDALANFEQTRQTLAAIRTLDPGVTFCLSTNGLMLPRYAKELIALSVSHITVTVNAADDETGARIYAYVDYDGVRYTGRQAASLLRKNQFEGIRMLSHAGVVVKVNIVLIKGINEEQIKSIVTEVKACGASITNIMQLIPVEGTAFENLELVSNKELNSVRRACEKILPQMYHCKQCRADAVGRLQEDLSLQYRGTGLRNGDESPVKEKSFRFAVSSKGGLIVNEHFGHTREFTIYDWSGGQAHYIGKRAVGQYCGGEDCGDEKTGVMEDLLETISDCDAVLCMRIGSEPKSRLTANGKAVFMTYDRIEKAVCEAAKSLMTVNKAKQAEAEIN